jgi:hypothetical protein
MGYHDQKESFGKKGLLKIQLFEKMSFPHFSDPVLLSVFRTLQISQNKSKTMTTNCQNIFFTTGLIGKAFWTLKYFQSRAKYTATKTF